MGRLRPDRNSMEMLLHGNALLALAAAVLWGGGDFSGGMGVKHAGGTMGAALRVILLSHAVSLVILLAIAWVRGDAFPHGAPLVVGAGGWGDGGDCAGLLLCGAVAGGDGGFGGVERVAGGGDSGGGVGGGGGVAGAAAVGGICGGGGGDLVDCGGAESGGEGGGSRDGLAGGGGRAWGLGFILSR